MRKKIVTLVLISAMTLFAACAGNNNKVIPTPTIQARPMELAPATATPIAATEAPTATPTATETPTETIAPTLQPTPTQAVTPTVKPTPAQVLIPTVKPTSTPVPTPTVTVVPTVTPIEEAEDPYTEGIITSNGYENEWLGLRLAKGKNTTILRDSDTWMTAHLDNGTIVQLLGEPVHYENMTAEEAASELKKELVESSDSEITFAVNDYYALEEVAEEEYISFYATMTILDTTVKQQYCVREQDGYLIYVVFTYEDSNGLTEAKNTISPY